MSEVIFNTADLFFDPVAAFYASWVGYTTQYAVQLHDVVSGRLRGFVVPQLKFEDDPIIGTLRRQEPVLQGRFEIDLSDPGNPAGKKAHTSHLMEFWCQQMFGHAYETAASVIEARFGSDRKKNWPPTLQFAYHIRNGCFHGNKFNILQNSMSSTISTEWRGRAIDYSDNGSRVAGQFLGPADFITLLYDMQVLLT